MNHEDPPVKGGDAASRIRVLRIDYNLISAMAVLVSRGNIFSRYGYFDGGNLANLVQNGFINIDSWSI